MFKIYVPEFYSDELWQKPSDASMSPLSVSRGLHCSDLDLLMSLACTEDNERFLCDNSAIGKIEECFFDLELPWRPIIESKVSGGIALPFAITNRSLQRCAKLGLRVCGPDLSVVRQANSKVWSTEIRTASGVAFGGVARSSQEVDRLYGEYISRGPVLFKEPHASSGSGNFVVASEMRRRTLLRLLVSQEEKGKNVEIVVEPMFSSKLDFSHHFTLDGSGLVTWIGWQQTLNYKGKYFGSRGVVIPGKAKTHLVEYSEYIASQLHRIGYFGPVCVDCSRWSDGTWFPLVELNARMSMGFLNLHLSGNLKKIGLGSTMIKMRIARHDPNHSLFDLLLEGGLIASLDKEGILPISHSCIEPLDTARDTVFAYVYRSYRSERRLWTQLCSLLDGQGCHHDHPEFGLDLPLN